MGSNSSAAGKAWIVVVAGLLAAGLLGMLLLHGGATEDPGPGTPDRAASEDDGPDGRPTVPTVSDGPQGLDGDRRGPEAAPDPAGASHTLVLRALDAWSGSPVTNFHVVEGGRNGPGARGIRARADRETGVARVENVHGPLDLTVRAAGYRPTALLVEAGATMTERTVPLERTTSIVGTVRDGASAPLAAAAVHLEFLGSDPSAIPLGADPVAFQGPTLRRTRPDGTYAFTDLPPGAYRTRVEVAGASVRSPRVVVVPGDWSTVDHWLDEHTRLSVTVLTPDGGPSAKTRVLLFLGDEEEPAIARYTDEQGLAVLGPLARGTYSLRIVSDHGAADPTSVLVSERGSSNISRTVRLAASPR